MYDTRYNPLNPFNKIALDKKRKQNILKQKQDKIYSMNMRIQFFFPKCGSKSQQGFVFIYERIFAFSIEFYKLNFGRFQFLIYRIDFVHPPHSLRIVCELWEIINFEKFHLQQMRIYTGRKVLVTWQKRKIDFLCNVTKVYKVLKFEFKCQQRSDDANKFIGKKNLFATFSTL